MLNTDQAIRERCNFDLFTGTMRDGPVTFRLVCGHPVYNAHGLLTGSPTELAQHFGVSVDELGPIV